MKSSKLTMTALCILLLIGIWPTAVWGADSSSDWFLVQDQNINYERG